MIAMLRRPHAGAGCHLPAYAEQVEIGALQVVRTVHRAVLLIIRWWWVRAASAPPAVHLLDRATPSGSWRVKVYAGADPLTGREIRLRKTWRSLQKGWCRSATGGRRRSQASRLLASLLPGCRPPVRVLATTASCPAAAYLAQLTAGPTHLHAQRLGGL